MKEKKANNDEEQIGRRTNLSRKKGKQDSEKKKSKVHEEIETRRRSFEVKEQGLEPKLW